MITEENVTEVCEAHNQQMLNAAANSMAGALSQYQGLMPAAQNAVDYQLMREQQEIVHAVNTLAAAVAIRANKPLMGKIRQHVRKQKDDLAALLDDIS